MKPNPSTTYSAFNGSAAKNTDLQGTSVDLFYYANSPTAMPLPPAPAPTTTQKGVVTPQESALMPSYYHPISSRNTPIPQGKGQLIGQPVQTKLPLQANNSRKRSTKQRYSQQKKQFQRLLLVVVGSVLSLLLIGLGLMQLAQWIVGYTTPLSTPSQQMVTSQLAVPPDAFSATLPFTPQTIQGNNADALFIPHRITGVWKGEPLNAPDVHINQTALPSVDAWLSSTLHWPYAEITPAPLPPLPLPTETTNPALQQTLDGLTNRLGLAFKPHVLFYDPFSNTHAEVNATDAVPSASVIKLPLLYLYGIHLAAGTMQPTQPILLEERHRVEGSGIWIGRPEHSLFRLHETAANMIQSSDNVATEMMLEALGGVDKVNAQWAGLGYHQTRVRNQLPDKAGLNTISMQEMVRTLMGIQQHPVFQTGQANVALMDILEHTHNRRLIPGLLPPHTRIFHKTGDIGKSLGESALVQLPDGRYYYLAMMIERPHNSAIAAEFIRQFSQQVYTYQVAHPIIHNKALWASIHPAVNTTATQQPHAQPIVAATPPSITANQTNTTTNTMVAPPPPEAVEVF
jgi:beta-lactamase class A